MAMCSVMAQLWKIFQPLLFGLIGAEIDIKTIEAKTIGLSWKIKWKILNKLVVAYLE